MEEIPAVLCEHANECPRKCPCPPNCYCKRVGSAPSCRDGNGYPPLARPLPPPPPAPPRPCIQDLVIQDLQQPRGDSPTTALVVADIEQRKLVGLERYGTLLYPHNSRNALQDAYEEVLDLCQYLRQAIEEGAWLKVTYHQALNMALHLRALIAERS